MIVPAGGVRAVRPGRLGALWSDVRLLLPAVAAGVVVAAGTLGSGWPFLRHEPVLAAVNIVLAGTLVTAGIFLAGSALLRRTGALLAGAGVCWLATWAMSWNTGPLPLVGIAGSCAFYVTFGTALLLYPDGRISGRADRMLIAFAVVVYGPLMALSVVTSRPGWNGYAADVVWPAPLADASTFGLISDVYLVLNPLLAAGFLILLVRRARGLRGPERAAAPLVLLAVGAALVGAALLAPAIETDDLAQVMGGVAWQGVVLAAFPLTLVVATGRRALGAATAADRVLRLAAPATVRSVRTALRAVLHDPTVEVYFWLPDGDGYVDVDGRPADPAGGRPRWSRAVATRDGAALAVLTGDPALGRHGAFTEAALRAGRLALENAQLQVAVRARLLETLAARQRLAGAEAAQRRRIARDLHEGVQQRLLALARAAGEAAQATEAAADSARARSALARLREGLLAANEEVRDLGRGLRPWPAPGGADPPEA